MNVESNLKNTASVPIKQENPLGVEPISKLLLKFAIPSIISFLVSALYNIVDQIFIGNKVGMLGNAATNVAFPLSTICTATGLLFGIGGAACYNLNMGAGKKKEADNIAGNGLFYLLCSGIIIGIIVAIFLDPLIIAFGASPEVFPYARTYTHVTCYGIPFVIFSIGGSHLIRADGSPKYSMFGMLSGAIINIILDATFVYGFNMGMAGAALATVIGQIASAGIVLVYFIFIKPGKLTKANILPKASILKRVTTLGMAACFNQLAMFFVQIVLNNSLTYYGGKSHYGSDIPMACVGIISKVTVILLAFMIGISQGCQPIVSFNYGAKQFARVRETYLLGAKSATIISTIFGIAFFVFPRQIVSIFGQGNEAYFQFAIKYFRIYLMFTFINGIQPLTANFFSAIGKATLGVFMSLTRQIIFLIPLILILPIFFGIDGIMFAGPIADGAAATFAVIFISRELKKLSE